jgi:hypothetical protein
LGIDSENVPETSLENSPNQSLIIMKARYISILTGYFLLLVCFFTTVLSTSAQTLSLNLDKAKTEDGQDVDAWVAILDQKEDDVRDSFEKFIKQEYSLRTEKRAKNILVVPKAKMVEIMALRGDLRAVFTPRGNSTAVAIAFSPGYDIHLSKSVYPEELNRVGTVAKKYVKFHYNSYYKSLLSDTEKKIKDKQDDINKNTNRISKLKGDISENEGKINGGDKQTPKLIDRNRKSNENIAAMETDNANWQNEIIKLQETTTQTQESMKKVSEF